MNIQFESSTKCNAKCVFCPRYEMTRRMGEMSDELFHKIIKQGKELGVKHFYPFLNGEPFVFPRIWEWLDYLEKENVLVTLYTNAEFMNVDKLIEYNNIYYVNCSINAAKKETYDKLMRGPDFYASIKNTEELIKKAKFRIKVSMVETEENKDEVNEFKNKWGVHANVTRRVNWAGARDGSAKMGRKKVCQNLVRNVNILWDGRVCLCCMDYNGQVILGDLNTEDLKIILERKKVLEDRHKRLDFNMTLCNKCDRNLII